MRRWANIALIAGAGLLALGAFAIGELLLLRGAATSAIASRDRIAGPGGIDTRGFVTIGGTRQWVSIRGRDRRNPVLLFLHGGPGSSLEPFAWTFQRPLEEYFTVVQWDQRGAGKSYVADHSDALARSLTFDRLVADSEELIRLLRKRSAQDRIFIAGHSWGTMLGLAVAKRHPEWLHAYVGFGQAVNMRLNEEVAYRALLAEASLRKDAEALAELRAIAPYPGRGAPPLDNIITVRKWLTEYGHVWGGASDVRFLASIGALSPDLSLWQLKQSGDASYFTGQRMVDELFKTVDIRRFGTRFDVPIVIFAGEKDLGTPSSIARDWFDSVKAPHKAFHHVKGAGHFVMLERPGETTVRLVTEVRPLAYAHEGN
jgi:pimeloyl-ACP methyl ester carboxylesterase